MSRARLLALALMLGGCDTTPAIEGEAVRAAERPERTPPRSASTASASGPRVPGPARPRHALSVRALEGDVNDGGWQVGTQLPENGEVVVARRAQLTLALDDYVSLRVAGPARLLALPEGEPALLVREGMVTVDCAPRAARTTASAFWLADSQARIDIVAGARFVWKSGPATPSALSVVSGNVELQQATALGVKGSRRAAVAARADGGAELQRVLLGPSTRCLGGVRELASTPAPDLTRAERTIAALSCGHAAVPPKERTEALRQRLRTQLDLIATGNAHERSLLEEHALRLREGGDAGALRGELAALASELMRERSRARALRAMWEAAVQPSSANAEERALAERARTLAPYAEQG